MSNNYVESETDKYGNTRYYDDQYNLHRTDGPAVEYRDGSKEWFIHGRKHRIDGPAYEETGGYKAWWVDGNRHRIDGPAIQYEGGINEWWVNGTPFTKEDFEQLYGTPKDKITTSFVPKYKF